MDALVFNAVGTGAAAARCAALSGSAQPARFRSKYPAQPPRALLLFLTLGLLCSGCRTFSQRGPVPEAVANCRQLTQQGIDCIHQNQWEQAELLLAQAVALCDTNAESRLQYAETLWRRGATKEAIAQIEAAVALNPDDATLRCRAGEMYYSLRDYQRAGAHAAQSLQRDGKLAAAWALRGRVQHASGERSAALADMQRALCYAPADREVLLAVAELQRESAQPQRALVTLLTLADLYPPGEEPPEVLYLTGLALSAMGRYGDAAEQYYAASMRGQPTAELLYRLAEAELLSGRPAEAEANARQALALNPQHAASSELLARMAQTRQTRSASRP